MPRRRPAMLLFILLGILLVGLAIALNVSWIILNWRRLVPMLIGIPIFLLLIAGVVLNTIFLVREVRRNERQNNFLNAVTHELKTPIASIRLYLETLQRHPVPDAKRQEFYTIMLADSDRLLTTVEQILKAGELTQGSATAEHFEHLDLLALVRSSVAEAQVRHQLPDEAIRLETQPAALAQVPVLGSAADLQSALMNVLGNAVKYSPGGAQITVRVTLRGSLDEERWAVVDVRDQGIGIPRAHLKRIFRRFYRVPTRRVLSTKGTGLGLFLVRTIARKHGGHATATSPGEGLGTTVTLELPVRAERGEA